MSLSRTGTEPSRIKGSHGSGEGGQRVEVALDWHKSSYSGPGGGECVEVAPTPAAVHVRDSKDPSGPVLIFSPDAWRAFTAFTAHAALDGPG